MDEIQSFISQRKLSGQTDEQIKQELLQTGWTEEQLSPFLGAPHTETKAHHTFPKKFWLAVIIILVLTVLTSVFVYTKIQPNAVNPSSAPNTTFSGKTYTNTKYRFSFDYPNKLTLNNYDQIAGEEDILELASGGSESGTTISIDISETQTSKDLYEEYKAMADGKSYSGQLFEGANEATVSVKEVTIDGNIAYMSTLESKTSIMTNVLLEKNNLIYALQAISDTEDGEKVLNQILATFKFAQN